MHSVICNPGKLGLAGRIIYSQYRRFDIRISFIRCDQFREQKIDHPAITVTGSILFGLISLFTYQNGFGCFLLPFLLHLISKPRSFRIIFIAIGFCLLIYVIYYFLFKYSLAANHIQTIERTQISINVFPKIRFFFQAPCHSLSFYFLVQRKKYSRFCNLCNHFAHLALFLSIISSFSDY